MVWQAYGLRQAVSKPPFYDLKVVEVIAKSLIKQKPLKQIEKLDQLLPLSSKLVLFFLELI